jgi:Tfp pilus assembly protein PilX
MFTRVRRDDTGIAMIMVLGVIMVMTLLVGTAIAYAMAVKPQAKRDQDWNAALAAAGAGVDDFVARVNKSDSYVLAVDCTNLAWKGPNTGTNSCGWSSSTAVGWLPVQAGKPAAGSSTTTSTPPRSSRTARCG